MDSELRIVRLDTRHDRASFDCGERTLNEFLARYALQNRKAGFSQTYVATEGNGRTILAYYTIAAGEVNAALLPSDDARKLPLYPVPVLRLCRLATAVQHRGKGLGGVMLIDVLRRAVALSEQLGLHAIEVDAMSDSARCFYERYGFRPLEDDARHLYLAMRTAKQATKGF